MVRRRRSRPPEIIQMSGMDCGPAALAALLVAHGLPARVDALREVCSTAVDGTSIDELEEVACARGLEAEQIIVPLAQVPGVCTEVLIAGEAYDGLGATDEPAPKQTKPAAVV